MADDVSREVDQLLKEREKYQDWLSRLESEKAKAPERAFERVRGDYERRLDEITGKLRAHSEALRGKLREAEQTVARLEAERAVCADELEEARLRRSVGEYPDENQWTELENRLHGSLQQMDGQLERGRAEISRLSDIMALVQGAEERAAAQPAPAAAQPPPKAAAPPPPPAPTPAPAPEPEPAAAAPSEPTEEGFLSLEELVLEDKGLEELGVTSEPVASPEPAPAEPPESEAAPAEPGVGDELAFLESLSLAGGSGAEGEGEASPESFSFLDQHGSGTPQTIICPHCSAANDPAEWYCTECGEELPAE